MSNEEHDHSEHEHSASDRDLLEQILNELRQLNAKLTTRSTSDRLNEEMDLVK